MIHCVLRGQRAQGTLRVSLTRAPIPFRALHLHDVPNSFVHDRQTWSPVLSQVNGKRCYIYTVECCPALIRTSYRAVKRHRGNLNVHYSVKEASVKKHMLYESNRMTFQNGQNCGDSKKARDPYDPSSQWTFTSQQMYSESDVASQKGDSDSRRFCSARARFSQNSSESDHLRGLCYPP